MKIVKGKTKPRGLRVVIYGVHGVGKTTLAAKLPGALFLDYEGGTHGLEVDKLSAEELPNTYGGMKGLAEELRRDNKGYERLVIDTADRFEAAMAQSLAAEKKVEDIFAVNDYGRTVAVHKAGMAGVLDSLSRLVKSGMDVVVLAHETSRKVEPLENRDTTGVYDHHEMKLSKTVSPLFMEWADLVIFCAYKTFLVAGDKKTDKAHVEGGKRWCFCSYSTDWDAKKRTGINLPADCSLDKMAEILPGALADAVERPPQFTVDEETGRAVPKDAPKAESRTKAEADAKDALAAKRAAKAASAPLEAAATERECIASLRRLLANYGVTEAQTLAYLRSNPKVAERYGSVEGVAFADLPDAVATWLAKGLTRQEVNLAEKIKTH